MVESDWGLNEPARFFVPAVESSERVYSDRPEDLPEVSAAHAEGFYPAHEAPLWCFIPAIWPKSERAWVRDCRVRHLTRGYSDGRSERLPWSAAEYAEIEDETNRTLAALGLPPRPAGRIWLLRPPAGYATLQAALDHLWAGWTDGPETMTPSFVDHVEGRLRSLF